MIIYSDTRYVPTDINMMVIRGNNNRGYYYVHRLLYDQAVVLYDLYSDDIELLVNSIIGITDMRDDVAYFLDNVPPPLNILGPFLLLVKEPLTELRDMVGAIHVLSGPFDFRAMLKVPVEVRNRVPRFSLSIKEEYELAWDRFFQTAIPYSLDMFRAPNTAAPMNGVATSVANDDMASLVKAANATAYLGGDDMPTVVESFDSIDINDEDAVTAAINAMSENSDFDAENVDVEDITSGMDEAALQALMNFQWDFDEPEEDESEDAEETEPEPTPAPVPAPEPEPVPEEKPAKLTGIDALLNMV